MGSRGNLGSTTAGAGAFRTTHWSVVLSARRSGSSQAGEALASLCQVYWYPLYVFVRRSGHDHHEAQDLVQEFFSRFIEKEYLQAVDRDKGRFRSFLLGCLRNFLGTCRERAQTAKRGGGYSFLSWEEATADKRYGLEPCETMTAEKLFDRQWALTLLEKAIQELKSEFAHAGKADVFGALQVFLSGEKNPASYEEIAAALKMSEPAVRVNVHRLRRRYGELIRTEIGRTVAAPAEIESELQHLFAVLSE
jgi:RNA polymerase sigma-70 factor (ECF subfamily)